ncbi:CZB domain-containing protein [Rufibacter roseus]|uniref:CZB domain-containing protein n=1 Tax=Rufibacter roseus TaxID=1567108 RepID=A0ABW2DLE1_9BACT|nr:CZB domain-containing protein [Rufibacter roseus]
MNQAQIDFQQLRIKHILFKSKVRSVLYGGTYDANFFSNHGPVNVWFNSVGLSKYRDLPEMQSLLQVHQELNSTTNLLISRYQSGKIEQAHEGLSKIDELSEKFLDLLAKLEGK